MCKRIKPLPATARMIHAKSFMSSFGLEDISSQHTMVVAQRSEFTPVLGQIDMLVGKQVWTTQIKIMAIAEHLLQATVKIQLFLNLARPMFLHKNKIAIQQKDATGWTEESAVQGSHHWGWAQGAASGKSGGGDSTSKPLTAAEVKSGEAAWLVQVRDWLNRSLGGRQWKETISTAAVTLHQCILKGSLSRYDQVQHQIALKLRSAPGRQFPAWIPWISGNSEAKWYSGG